MLLQQVIQSCCYSRNIVMLQKEEIVMLLWQLTLMVVQQVICTVITQFMGACDYHCGL